MAQASINIRCAHAPIGSGTPHRAKSSPLRALSWRLGMDPVCVLRGFASFSSSPATCISLLLARRTVARPQHDSRIALDFPRQHPKIALPEWPPWHRQRQRQRPRLHLQQRRSRSRRLQLPRRPLPAAPTSQRRQSQRSRRTPKTLPLSSRPRSPTSSPHTARTARRMPSCSSSSSRPRRPRTRCVVKQTGLLHLRQES